MRNKKETGSIKKKIALAALFVGAVLSVLTFLFIQTVQNQLWEQSIQTIMESTGQGCNTLKIQLQDDFEAMGAVARKLKDIPEEEDLAALIDNYAQVETGINLYMEDGRGLPSDAQIDEKVSQALQISREEHGIIDPHISSVTGMNVFNLYIRIQMGDGTIGYLVKEYEVENIVDTFSLSFYNGEGFSYVVNQQGRVLIRPPHPNSNKTVKNLFDMLPEAQNSPDSLAQFKQSLKDSRTGWAVFNYQGKETVFCYIPLGMQSDWYLISIIPQNVVSAQTNEILARSLFLIGSVILGIVMLVAFYLRDANRTNRKLRSQAQYIEHLYNAVPEGIALISVEEPYQLLQLNEKGLRLLGYPREAANDAPKGKCLQDVIYAQDYGETAQLFHSAAAGSQKRLFENRIVRADGSLFWAAGVIEKMLDENGQTVIIAAFHDITEEKLAKVEAEKKKLQERITLVGAISNAYPVIISLNLTRDLLSFIYVQQGLMIQLGEQRTYSELFQQMLPSVHPDSLEEFRHRLAPEKLLRSLGKGKNEAYIEARQMLTDHQYHWISTQIIYVDNPYSDDKLAILISRRVDEQRHEEEQRRQALQSALDNAKAASEAKSRFLSNMSHDIRTPMNAIVGMTAIATAHLNDQERVRGCLKKIGLSSQHLLSLINDVLDMSKIESGKLTVREEPFNLAELMVDTVELVRPQADAARITMDVYLEALGQEQVIGDPLRIRQVFLNILSNAVKYTLSEGRVRVELRQEKSARRGYQRYVFRCADTGIGMSEEFLQKLFQPFERAQDSTGSKIMGTGLGMAITKNLVDLMNGQIQVESTPGAGSVFTVALVLRPQEADNEEIPEEWAGVHSFIVDDDLQSCENAVELLRDMGLRAEFATDGVSAIQNFTQVQKTEDPFRLVIVDWKMPGMDGVEVVRRIRTVAGTEIPVIILSAYDWSEIENEARQAGVTAFLSKPFYRSKICYLLEELCGEKSPRIHSTAIGQADYAGKRILLVEDNEMNREIARTLIEEMGAQVEEACDGVEAVERVAESEEGYYDLIFMDIQMPRMNGYEATRGIRSLKRQDAGSIPIIAMTANAFEEDVQAALSAGMNEHFAKPVDVHALEQILWKYLSPAQEESIK